MRRGGWEARASRQAVRLLASETQCAEESSMATSAGTFFPAPKHWGLEWVSHQGRLTMAWVPIMGGLTVFSAYLHHTEEWTERNQQLLDVLSLEIRKYRGLWIVAGDFNMEPGIFGQHATPERLPGVLVRPASGAEHRFDWSTAQWRARFWKCACLRIQASALIIRFR